MGATLAIERATPREALHAFELVRFEIQGHDRALNFPCVWIVESRLLCMQPELTMTCGRQTG